MLFEIKRSLCPPTLKSHEAAYNIGIFREFFKKLWNLNYPVITYILYMSSFFRSVPPRKDRGWIKAQPEWMEGLPRGSQREGVSGQNVEIWHLGGPCVAIQGLVEVTRIKLHIISSLCPAFYRTFRTAKIWWMENVCLGWPSCGSLLYFNHSSWHWLERWDRKFFFSGGERYRCLCLTWEKWKIL